MLKVLGTVVIGSMLVLSACNTVSGVGRDVSSAGKTVSKTAEEAK